MGLLLEGNWQKKRKEKRNRTFKPSTLTGHIEVDEHLVFAHFVLSRALVHDGHGGVADVKRAHYL